MTAHPCCRNRTRAIPDVESSVSWLRRGGEIAGWTLPAAILALLPKCPVCVAAYVALATGIGISLPAAATLRTTLMLLCLASLAFCVVRRLRG